MRKIYIIDSSVFLAAPHALRCFDDNEVIIPMSVIKKMATVAQSGGPHHREAATFIRMMDELIDAPGSTTELENGGRLTVTSNENLSIYDEALERGGIIVTRDPAVRVIAHSKRLMAEPFRHDQEPLTDHIYTGRCRLYVSDEEMSTFAKERALVLDKDKDYYAVDEAGVVISESHRLMPNEYVILTCATNPSAATMLGRFDGTKIVPLSNRIRSGEPIFGVLPRNVGQRFALDALLNPDIPLVILRGPAGTAKSFLSMAAGLDQTMEQKRYKKCLLTRPNTKMDNDIGYLKGDEIDKIMPILRGLLDNIDNLMDMKEPGTDDKGGQQSAVTDLMDMGIVEMQSLAYMRGRSIVGQYIVADEMQNSTPTQALSIITRAGEGTKIVICGDTEQIDTPYMDCHSNGMVFAAERMKASPLCAQITFTEEESTRSALAQEAIQLMGQDVRD